MKTCAVCTRSIASRNAQARYCSTRCRVTAHRAKKHATIPQLLTRDAQWVRHTADKRPITTTGKPASSTNPTTWATYDDAANSTAGVGLGYVLTGTGIGCYDLDHCMTDGQLNNRARDFLNNTEHFYAEVSPSQTGIHIWHHAKPQPGWKKTIDGLHVEHYTQGRYITVTGHAL